jgi:hypothetical protein
MKLKSILLWFSFFVMSKFSFGQSLDDIMKNYYVVSDVVDKKIPKGSFIVEGEIKMFSSTAPLEGVQVGSLQTEKSVKSDNNGFFKLVLNTKADTGIYFYKEGWSELKITNYKFLDRRRITLTVYLHQEKNHVKRKPVIYAYSEKEISASIKINPMGNFTFTYPTYNDGWNVNVNSSGTLFDLSTQKNYPYLFWEAESKDFFYQMNNNQAVPGFFIETDTTIQFLENKLDLLNLNTTEITDFITYWGPIFQRKKYAFIQFVIDEEYDQSIAGLQVNPKPDAIRRVFILYSALDELPGFSFVDQQLNGFLRKGFTIVEWGGAEIDLSIIQP